jgi:pyrroline-5-carboxylate reductase
MLNSICFLGAGNMGEALIKGYKTTATPNADIGFLETNEERADYIQKTYQLKRVFAYEELNNYQILIVGVKPQVFTSIVSDLSKFLSKDIVIVSVVAGTTIKYYKKYFKKNKIIRVMPNTPCLIQKGISVVSACKDCSDADINPVKKILSSFGDILFMKEEKMNAVTALSGSGPAYFYHILDVFAKQAKDIGINYNDALFLITKTMLGSAEMVLGTNKPIEELIAQVKSPGGTTEAALKKLQKKDLNTIIKKSLQAAYKRANELSKKE